MSKQNLYYKTAIITLKKENKKRDEKDESIHTIKHQTRHIIRSR